MGITGLAKLIADIAPFAVKETEFKNYFGRKVAIDASEKKSENADKFMISISSRHVLVSVPDCGES
jgi:hypothetical protein